MLRVMQCINALTWGGAQVLVADLCRHLRGRGHEPMVVAFRDGPIGDRLRQAGIRTVILPEAFFDLVGFFRLRSLIREFDPDIVHTHLFRATLWGRLAMSGRRGPRLVSSIHGMESQWYDQVEKRMAPLSARLIFPSRHLREWFASAVRPLPDHRCAVLYPGATVSPPGPPPPVRAVAHVGSLSRLHPVKGLDVLIRACRLLREWGLPFRLFVGGDGREKNRLVDLARDLGIGDACEFVGSVLSKSEFLENLDVFVAPSRQEAFGLTVCEAMERGRPVVASNIGGLPELIRPGETGFLFEPGNHQALALQLRALLENPAVGRQVGRAAREVICSRFPRERWLEAHEQLYARLADRPRNLHLAISSTERGGGENLALSLARTMGARGWRLSATCGRGPLQAELVRRGIPVRSASLRAGGVFFAARLAADVKRGRFAAVHAHLNRAALLAGLLKPVLRVPVVAHVHGLNRASYYRRSDRLIAVSEAVRKHLADQGVPPGQMLLLPNAIDKPALAVKRDPGPPWTIAIVAKLHANKGHGWALAALEARAAELPEFRILLFGDGPEREPLSARFSGGALRDRLTFMGFQADLDRFYPGIHLLLLPSLGEGIPLSLLEAMRWGIPSVATRVGGIPEIVKPGENGFLVVPGAADELLDALKKAMNPWVWSDLSAGSVRAFAQLNSFDRLADQFERCVLALGSNGPVTP